jgi:hypothetical protein
MPDPASVIGDLGAAKQERFRELFRQYFDVEASARSLPEHIGVPRLRCSGGSSLNFTRITSSSAIHRAARPRRQMEARA